MQTVNPLIRTKLHMPAPRQALVVRPRLQEQIAQGLCYPLTLVTAPAGFGKTTLVVSSIAASGRAVAWLSLDKNDNQPGRFLTYLIAALQTAAPTVGNDALQLASQQAPFEAVLASLINDLDSSDVEFVLVLDDYQFISSPAVHAAVAFLLEHAPATFHLLIATRSDPPLPVARLRAHGQVVELRATDLSFTEFEAAQFLNDAMGIHLDPASIAMLTGRTEGWVAGLQMAALSLRGREDVQGFVQGFSGTNRHILDYLLEEVLKREPEDVQNFLLQTSILTCFTGPLCDAVTGLTGSQAMLAGLEKRNLFLVALDDDRRWYRYHHLFTDLLQARLRLTGLDRVAGLYVRAASWCEQQGQVVEAVGYAFAAQDYERAAELVGKYWGPLTSEGEVETAWSWLSALPEAIVRHSAPLSIACCWVLWLQGHPDRIEPHLIDAERALGALVAGEDVPEWSIALPAQLETLRAIITRYHNDFEAAITLANRALNLLPEGMPPQANAQLRSLIFMALASAYDGVGDLPRAADAYAETIRWSQLASNAAGLGITIRLTGALRLLGRLPEALAACQAALAYLQAQGMVRLPAAGILHIALAEILVEQNELETAQSHLTLGLELGKWSGRLDAVRNTPAVLVRLRLAQGDARAALAAVQEAEAAMGDPVPPLAMAELLALRARILAWQGLYSEAAHCAQEAVRAAGRDLGQTGQAAALAACRVRAAQNPAHEAIEHLAQSIATAEKDGRLGVVLELLILRSLAFQRSGNAFAAETDLERALSLAAPAGYIRLFLDEGQPMQALLAQWLAYVGEHSLREYAARLLSLFPAGQIAPPTPSLPQKPVFVKDSLADPLTRRELDVLHLLAQGCSNRQIAEKLFLSEGTVKFYVHAIMEKLGAGNRTQAILIAREHNLL